MKIYNYSKDYSLRYYHELWLVQRSSNNIIHLGHNNYGRIRYILFLVWFYFLLKTVINYCEH